MKSYKSTTFPPFSHGFPTVFLGIFLSQVASSRSRDADSVAKKPVSSSGWRLTYPSEKYESVLVSWDDEIPNWIEK